MADPSDADPIDAELLVPALGLEPHPEGGWYRRVWASPDVDDAGRPAASVTLYLLARGGRSYWHRLDAPETWRLLAGGPLVVSTSPDGTTRHDHELATPDDEHLVPAHTWQGAQAVGAALVAVAMTPAFVFEGFELAPADWEPG